MYLLAFFILQHSKNIRIDSELWGCAPFWAQNGPFVLNKNFLVQTIVITFIYVLVLSTGQNLKKFLQRIQNYDDGPKIFGPKMVHLPPQNFFLKSYYYHSHLPIRPFHCAKFFKKILPVDLELWGCAIYGP